MKKFPSPPFVLFFFLLAFIVSCSEEPSIEKIEKSLKKF